jgi:metallo-beta-lactamase class B
MPAVAQNPPDHPAVTVDGRTYTPASIFERNMGSAEDQESAFPPHKIVGNIYYVGTRTLSSFLIVTPQGHILIDTTYERNVGVIRKSVEQLGFKFEDIKIVLGNHAHSDHQEGDALVKQMTGAQVMAMAEDVQMLQAMKPGGKDHPIDKILHDGDTVAHGGTTLVAHLTAGHTPGATTWTMKASEAGKNYDVVFFTSLRTGNAVTPAVAAAFDRSFALVRTLPCDVPLGDHPAEFRMQEKYAKLQTGEANPYIDRARCLTEADIQEAMYHALVAERSAVEDIYVVRSFREARDPPSAFCAEQRTGFGGATREDRFTFRSIALSTTGLVTDTNVATVGRLHSCVGPVLGTTSLNFYAEGVLGTISFSGRGDCATAPEGYPEAGLTVQRCFLQLGQLPAPYVGGQLTTNTISSRATLGGVSDPPGYTQPSIATVRLWKRRE